MNKKIIIPISITIIIIVITFGLTQNEITQEQTSIQIERNTEIGAMLEKIEDDKIKNESLDKPYSPQERKWIQSGPFQIDRSEYILGEKIFVNIINLPKNSKGEMIFTRIIDSTSIFEYKKIPFDGSKPQQNFYLSIDLFDKRKICTVDQIIGDWELRFVGENGEFNKIDFKILDKIMPGEKERYEPVC
ncbi:MAG TPA: hypothetical protein QF656_04875 [Nitrosopumilus sp.]|nr:hypothetical protein [Nitrosopumilus sp.]